MTTCVDWQAILRRASFRGARFWVEEDQAKYGRRLVVHEFPNRDRPFVEDMGEKAIHFTVNAYVAGDASLGEAGALIAACRQRGAGSLVLPTDGGTSVRCISCERQFHLDKLGFIGFKLEFVEAGAGIGAFPIGLMEALAGAAAVSAVTAIVGSFMSTFTTLTQDSWVVAAARGSVLEAVAALDVARQHTTMDPDVGADVYQQLTVISRNADALAADGPDTVAVRQANLSTAGVANATGGLPTAIANVVQALREGAGDEIAAAETLWALADYGLPAPVPQSTGASERQLVANAAAVGTLVRQIVLVELATAVAWADWSDRATAVRWRARIAEAFAREIGGAAPELRVALADVRGRAVEAISRKMADLQPVVTVRASAVTPSIVWAYRLYGDAARAGDLVGRNNVRHPSAMPTVFAAVAAPANAALSRAEVNAGLT